MTSVTCATCPFWDSVSDQLFDGMSPQKTAGSFKEIPAFTHEGLCRAVSPKSDRCWPRTLRLDWCGEHPAFHTFDQRVEAKP